MLQNDAPHDAKRRLRPTMAEQRPQHRATSNGASAARQRRPAPARREGAGAIELGVLHGHLGYFLRRAQVSVFQAFIQTLESIDVRPAQYSVLVVIGANPNLSQSDVAQLLGIERARLVRLLDRLERRGLVRRLAAPNDRRSNALQLTRSGQQLLRRAMVLAARHEAQLVARVGEERHQFLLEALQAFAK
jgi:DNA-binding MarR family transcriptional regulator